MKQHWNEVQPIDGFSASANGIIHPHDNKVLMLLYQPLIGAICTNLYTTLSFLLKPDRLWSGEWNHYHLMNLLDMNLEDIYHARLKLEGIGLLKTFVKEEDTGRAYVYELQPPLSAEQFFTDGMLNIYLYQKVGRSHFLKLKQHFSDVAIESDEFKEVTRSFQDVFTSMSPHALNNFSGHEASVPEPGMQLVNRETATAIHIDGQNFDFDLLLAGLSTSMVPRRALTMPVKDTLVKLSFLYGINEIDMQQVVLSSVTADDRIDQSELRKAARDWCKINYENRLPKLDLRRHQTEPDPASREPMTKEEKLISYLETITPRQLLIDLAEGAQPAMSDLTAIEEVMFGQNLNQGVINVLIHYVMLKTDMKLVKSYMEKIASHWNRKKVKTVQDAIHLAKSEHSQYQDWAQGKKQGSHQRKKPVRTEKLPDWFFVEDEQATAELPKESNKSQQDMKDLDERRKKLLAIQRKYQKTGGEEGGKH